MVIQLEELFDKSDCLTIEWIKGFSPPDEASSTIDGLAEACEIQNISDIYTRQAYPTIYSRYRSTSPNTKSWIERQQDARVQRVKSSHHSANNGNHICNVMIPHHEVRSGQVSKARRANPQSIRPVTAV